MFLNGNALLLGAGRFASVPYGYLKFEEDTASIFKKGKWY